MPRQSKKPSAGMVDPRDLTTTPPQPDYDDIDASDEAALSKRMTKDRGSDTRSSGGGNKAPLRKGAISRVSKSEADRPRRKTRGGSGPR